ncbi:MAG: outer membrane protein assembly factor BamD [Gammaproteobacteria bacterium]|nr:outer membrane protein assembly factor BamD [Gammaproteobacteria bacterium]
MILRHIDKYMRKINWSNLSWVVVLFAALVVSGCAGSKKKKELAENMTAEEMYAAAQDSMSRKNWLTAVERLRNLEAKYPYGKYAEQAQLDTVYSYYKNRETGLAISAADRFIRLHPTHESVDYAYYLKGLSSYEEDKSLFGRLSGQDDLSDRDASLTSRAMKAFEEVYTLFPESRYAPDSRARAKYLLNALARHEIAVANYYYTRQAYVAVVNRAKGILENYSTTASVEQALALLMFSYQNMGLADLSGDTRRILELNYPQSTFLTESSEDVVFTNWYSAAAKKEKKSKGRIGGWFSSLFDRFRN